MEQYIVYSSGVKGYGLYVSSPDFPDAYRGSVEDLYAKQQAVSTTNNNGEPFCYRFAPLNDRYLFSVIYKGCTCEAEKRPFFSTVNWLFTKEEADEFWGSKVQQNFACKIKESDAILLDMGYAIPDRAPIDFDVDNDVCENSQQAILTAVYYATVSGYENKALGAQVFLGRDAQNSMFSPLFWLMSYIPKYMRRHISFHIGATDAVETKGVALVVAREEALSLMAANSNYSGAMAVRKIIIRNGEFSVISSPSPFAKAYLSFSNSQRERLCALFASSDNCSGFWQYIKAVNEADIEKLKGSSLAALIGEKGLAKAIKNNVFTDDELWAIYQNKDEVSLDADSLKKVEECVKPLIERSKKPKKGNDKPFSVSLEEVDYVKTEEKPEKRKGNNKKHEKSEDKKEKPKHQRKKPKHSKEERKAALKESFKKREKAKLAWDAVKRIVIIVVLWLTPVLLGGITFVFGLLGKEILKKQDLLAAYGIQIAVLLLIAIPMGYCVIALTQQQVRCIKAIRKKKEKGDD